MWKLFRETEIFLQVTRIADVTTACSCYFTKAAILVTLSYPLRYQWLRQQHSITRQHKQLFSPIVAAYTIDGHTRFCHPLEAWTKLPTIYQ